MTPLSLCDTVVIETESHRRIVMNTLKLLPSQRVYNGELSYWKAQAMVLAQRNDDLKYIVGNQQKELEKMRINA